MPLCYKCGADISPNEVVMQGDMALCPTCASMMKAEAVGLRALSDTEPEQVPTQLVVLKPGQTMPYSFKIEGDNERIKAEVSYGPLTLQFDESWVGLKQMMESGKKGKKS